MVFGEKKSGKMADMHCHILPAVDDGARNMEQTIKMLQIARDEGIEAMIVTPHYKEGRRNADADTILGLLEAVQWEAESRGIFLPLYPGNEIFYFGGIEERLERGEILTLNNTDRVLIEFSPMTDYTYIRNALDGVSAMGYVPVLAHVERYECMVRSRKHVEELKQMDVEIQVNAAGISGQLGKEVQKFLYAILQDEMVDYVGTDAHDAKKRAPCFQKCFQTLKKRFDTAYIQEIFYENTMAIINAE